MTNVKDPYLIEYFVKNGYDRKEVVSEQFNIDDLEEDFETPIDLSKVSNLEELKIFFMVSVSFLIGESDITTGRAYLVSKLLPDFKLIGKEPGLRLDRLFMGKNAISIVKIGEAIKGIESHILLDNFDLDGFEFDVGDRDASVLLGTDKRNEKKVDSENRRYAIKINSSFDKNKDALIIDEKALEFPDISFVNCSNIELSKFNKIPSVISLDITGGKNISCNEKTSFCILDIKKCKDEKTSFLKNVSAFRMHLTNLKNLDLADIDNFDIISIDNVENCYASENCEFDKSMYFSNVLFSNPYDTITTITDTDMKHCSKQDASTMFDIQNADFKNCNFDLILGSRVNKCLRIRECYDVDKRIEEVIDRADEINDFSLSISDIEGYDIRKAYNVIDLNSPTNMDLLFDDEKLAEILRENKYLQAIQVSANLTDKQKAILGKYAPNAQYGYVLSFFGVSDKVGSKSVYDFYNVSSNLPEQVDFEKYMAGEKIYKSIIDGMDKNLTELEKFKYIYNALGKMVSYDINTLKKNDDKESNDRANLVSRNPFSSIFTRKGVCAGYAEMYAYMCRKARLSCEIEHGDGHAYNLIGYKDEKGENVKSYCDLTWDSSRIKCGFECKYFARGFKEFSPDLVGHRKLKNTKAYELDREYVEEIDKELGYNYLDEKYDKIVDKARKIKNIQKRTKYVLDRLTDVKDTSEMSNHEVMSLANSILSRTEDNNVGVSSAFIRCNSRNDKDVRDILWIKNGDEYTYYTFNPQQQEYKLLGKDVVCDLLASGMLEFYKDEVLPGFENWMSEKDYEIMRQYGFVETNKNKESFGKDR